MTRWTCPRCDREFGRAHQGHTCVPGCTVDETFAGHSAAQRAVYDAVLARVLGPGAPRVVHVLLLRAADEVDTQVRDWLTEAFLHASDAAPPPQVAPLDQ